MTNEIKLPKRDLNQRALDAAIRHFFDTPCPDDGNETKACGRQVADAIWVYLDNAEQSFDPEAMIAAAEAADANPAPHDGLTCVEMEAEYAKLHAIVNGTQQAECRIATYEEIERLADALATSNNDNLAHYEGPRGERAFDNPYRLEAYVALHALGYKIPGLIDCCNPGQCKGCPGCQGVKF